MKDINGISPLCVFQNVLDVYMIHCRSELLCILRFYLDRRASRQCMTSLFDLVYNLKY